MQHPRHHAQDSGLFDTLNQDKQPCDQRKNAPGDIPQDLEIRLSAYQKDDDGHGCDCNECW
jgi:hypothetical protein